MSAADTNNNSPAACQQTLGLIPHLDTVALRLVIAASVGRMVNQLGHAHAGKVLAHLLDAARPDGRPLTLNEVAFQVAQKHDVAVADLRRPHGDRGAANRDYTLARQEAFWLARRQRFGGEARPRCYSYLEIGRFFGGRDHTTVLYGVRQHKQRLLIGGDA